MDNGGLHSMGRIDVVDPAENSPESLKAKMCSRQVLMPEVQRIDLMLIVMMKHVLAYRASERRKAIRRLK